MDSEYDLFVSDPRLGPSWIVTVRGTLQEATEQMRSWALKSPGHYFLYQDFKAVACVGDPDGSQRMSQDLIVRTNGDECRPEPLRNFLRSR